MLRILSMVFFVLSCQAVFGDTRILTDKIIQVTPTNAANNEVWFSRTNDLVTVTMPVTKEARPFRDAILECTNPAHHFSIPIHAIQTPDMIIIDFHMDRHLLRECTLTVGYEKDLKETDYVFSLMDFIPEVEASSNK